MSIDHIKSHKYIAAREKNPKGIIVTVGYTGKKPPRNNKAAQTQNESQVPGKDDYLYLYPDKNAHGHYIIPAEAIVDHEYKEGCDDDGRVTLYIKADAVIQYEQPIEAKHFKPNNEPFDDGRPGFRPYHPPVGRGCFEACLRNIASEITNFSLRFSHFTSSNASGHTIKRTLNDKGIEKLRACLYACGYRGAQLEVLVAAGIKRLTRVTDIYIPQYEPHKFFWPNISLADRFRNMDDYSFEHHFGF